MSLFDNEFIDALPEDPKIALHKICQYSSNMWRKLKTLEAHLEAYALIKQFVDTHDLDFEIPPLTHKKPADKIAQIEAAVQSIKSKLKEYVRLQNEDRILQNFESKFATQLRGAFHYEFSNGDLSKIQKLINELRELFTNSQFFEEKHRRRLLKRLEKLQSELNKKMADLDHFWGLVGDAGVVIGKFGKDVKPIVDRMREIVEIVWRTQSRAEELSTDSKPALDFQKFEEDL